MSETSSSDLISATPIRIGMSSSRILLAFALLLLVCLWIWTMALGYLPLPPKIPEFALVPLGLFLTVFTLGYAFVVLPPIISGYEIEIRHDGIVARSHGKELIPWSAIAKIELVVLGLPKRKQPLERIDLMFEGILSPSLDKQVRTNKWRNFRKGVIATIIPENLNNVTAPELYKVLCEYHVRFGGKNV